MSKKLLSEAQVRRFQSLASIQPLNEMYNEEEEKPMEEELIHEEEFDEGYAMKRDEQPMEAMNEEEPEADDGDVDVDMDADGDDDVEIEEEMVEKAAAALSDLQALVDALGGEAAADMGDDALDMGDEPPGMDDAPDMGDEEEPAPLEEEDLLELALEGINYQPSQKEIVKEVAKRVARRLQEAKKAQSSLNKALGRK